MRSEDNEIRDKKWGTPLLFQSIFKMIYHLFKRTTLVRYKIKKKPIYNNNNMKWIKLCLRLLLGAFMTYAGVSHLTFNRTEFVAQVPMWVRFNEGFTDFVVLASGVVEILLGLSMIFLFKKKATVGALLAIFFVLIFPGNLNQYFYHIDSFGLNTDTARLIRLFFQPVLIAWALWSTGGCCVLKEWWNRIANKQ